MKQQTKKDKKMGLYLGILPFILIAFTGCPIIIDEAEYERGFNDGFAQDDYYWAGFFDSYDTINGGTIYYQGDKIPQVESPAYDAGYYDGLWFAYNDGYFVEYDYAFTIGFSEGYDCAYQSGWQTFLATDKHVEWLDGGFSDGYNDGFSEGRVFGAYDYYNGLPFDWLDAMIDYRSGTDLSMAGVATGDNGPVILYEWGTDPKTLLKSKRNVDVVGRSIRFTAKDKNSNAKFSPPDISYRPMIPDAEKEYNIKPATSPRYAVKPLTLTSTWLERINQYRSALGQK
ncbi:MAG TPA: hypothetical protein PLA12_05925 [Candidatus Hydrogenedens sp.]|nr:hypothetical protein [Candidatus Hydrogenedens sp.]